MDANSGRRGRLVEVLASLAVFFALQLPLLRLISISGDDAQCGLEAWKILAGLRGGRLALPLMRNPIHGASSIYFYVPFVLAFGRTVAAVHWHNAFLSAAALLATYALGLRLSGDRWTAFFASLLLACDPSLVLYATKATPAHVGEAALGAAALALLLAYADRREPRLAYGAFACLGLAVAGKSALLAYAAGVFAFLAAGRLSGAAERWLPAGARERRRLALGCLACFFAFVAPLLLSPLLHRRQFLSAWVERLQVRSEVGGNAAYGRNLLQRLRQVRMLLDGTSQLRLYVRQGVWSYRIAGAWPLLAGVLATAVLLRRTRWALPLAVTLVYLLLSPLSPSRLRDLHLVPLLPLLFLMACAPLSLLSGRRRAWALAAVAAFCAYRIVAAGLFFRKLEAALARTGGAEGIISPVTYQLIARFEKVDEPHVLFYDTYSHAVFEYLYTRPARVEHLEYPFPQFVVTPTRPGRELWDEAFADRGSYFVVERSDARGEANDWEVKRQARRRGLRAELADEVKFPTGATAYAIYRAARR